ncbi:MAG TPA: hypothetical protein VFE33_02830 [Thermoanaerobaculia bacterium]|nr:hypothetical protein [Thermoanaerobaculia bacterium]
MSNLRTFPNPHSDDEHDSSVPEKPDSEKLQRLLGNLIDATSSLPQRRDREIRIRNFRSDRLELIDDLNVIMEDRDGQYIANSYDTGQYGHGFSPDDAIYNLCSVLEDYYDLLIEDEERLSEPLKAHLRYLRATLRTRK